MGDVVQLHSEYAAKQVRFSTGEGYLIKLAGTLEGTLDFCIETPSGSHTYVLTPQDAHRIIAGLHEVCADIQAHCQFDRDPRLVAVDAQDAPQHGDDDDQRSDSQSDPDRFH